MIRFNIDINKNRIDCKGVFWKGYKSTYISSSGSIDCKILLRKLKRISCSGCVNCGWIDDTLGEEIANDLLDISNVENGKIYILKTEESQSYFDLYPEIDNLYFEEVKINDN